MKFREVGNVSKFASKLKNELCTKLETGKDYGIVLDKIDELLDREIKPGVEE